MKTPLLSNIILLFPFVTLGQDPATLKQDSADIQNHIEVKEKPEFPEGDAQMMKFFNMNIKYPKVDHENGIEGTVYANFEIDTAGNLVKPEIVKCLSESLNRGVLRVIKRFPKFSPAKDKGRRVKVRYRLHMNFKLG